jgi:hypothetical protein
MRHANAVLIIEIEGYWVGDELVILSSSRDLTVTIPEPSPLSAPISLEEYSARELKDVFGRVFFL